WSTSPDCPQKYAWMLPSCVVVSRCLSHHIPPSLHPPEPPIACNWAPGPTTMRAAAHGGRGWQGLCFQYEGKLLASHDGMHGQSGLPLGWLFVVLLTTAYRRGRRGSRRGPSRSSRGRASLTVHVRPPRLAPCSPAIAARASMAFGISTKPKPRGRPVSRSCIIWTLLTTP